MTRFLVRPQAITIGTTQHGTDAGSKSDKVDRGRGVCTLPEMRRGEIGICIATQIGRYVAPGNPLPGWHAPEIAWAQTQGQLAWYQAMEEAGQMIHIKTKADLNRVLAIWQDDDSNSPARSASEETKPIGFVLSLEGADSIVNLSYLE